MAQLFIIITPVPPLSCVVTEFFLTGLRHVVCVREDLNYFINTQIFKPNHNLISNIQTHANIRKVKCPEGWMKETLPQWKQPSLKSISSRCSPRHLHYSPLCCRCLATLLTIPHFVPIIHMVWLFDMRENWQITGWRAVTSQIHVVTGAHEVGLGPMSLGGWAEQRQTLALLVVD